MKTSACLLLLSLLLLFSACAGDDVTINGALRSGSLKGWVKLNDSTGETPITHAGVVISATGLSQTTVSDSSGFWELKEVPSGTYDLLFSKKGYGSLKSFGVTYAGGAGMWLRGTTDGETAFILGGLPSIPVTIVSVTDTITAGEQTKFIKFATAASALAIVLSSDDRFSVDSTTTMMFAYYSVSPSGIALRPSTLNSFGFRSGTRVYVHLHSTGKNNVVGTYYDPRLRTTVRTAIGPPSEVVEFIVP